MKKYKTYFSKEFLLIEVLMHFFVYREWLVSGQDSSLLPSSFP
jgi:hypothetical protein